jgi:hypothetical protein
MECKAPGREKPLFFPDDPASKNIGGISSPGLPGMKFFPMIAGQSKKNRPPSFFIKEGSDFTQYAAK